jgi:2-amino-4-hydroxy-6-hydroxymethyldihydropteridine diphosphokinase
MTAEPAGERQVVLALGSNLGDGLANLRHGLEVLTAEPGLWCTAVSAVFQSSPVGGPDQPDYLNAVLLAASELTPMEVLGRCLAAERALGRVRTVRWGPRTLDVDVIACGDEISDDPVLTLPHPRASERAFVLAPWHDVDPDAYLPGAGPVADLLAKIGMDGVRRLFGVRLAGANPDAGGNPGAGVGPGAGVKPGAGVRPDAGA